ncbi:MAG TPA: hypothetical protein VFO36_01500, partial [Nitrospiraceae bacterium]|nr:hypothetical protein [Nitrospiraceae bacterium]
NCCTSNEALDDTRWQLTVLRSASLLMETFMNDRQSRKLDDALDKTFPASDPVAIGQETGTEPVIPIDRKPPAAAEQMEEHPERRGSGTADPIERGNKIILVGIAALAGGLLFALSSMLGDNGTHNDANNRGPSGEAHNPTGASNASSPKGQ